MRHLVSRFRFIDDQRFEKKFQQPSGYLQRFERLHFFLALLANKSLALDVFQFVRGHEVAAHAFFVAGLVAHAAVFALADPADRFS